MECDSNTEIVYSFNSKENGVYFMLIDGEVTINNQQLKQKDAFGVWDTDKVVLKANCQSKILAIEIPMDFD
jgi:redox-sensitive bicupin YhaK (pirin superfamily)